MEGETVTEHERMEKIGNLVSLIEEDEKVLSSLKDQVKDCQKRIDSRMSEIRTLGKARDDGQGEIDLEGSEKPAEEEPGCLNERPHDWLVGQGEPVSETCTVCGIERRKESEEWGWVYIYPMRGARAAGDLEESQPIESEPGAEGADSESADAAAGPPDE